MNQTQISKSHGVNMKKQLLIISIIVVIVSIFVSCSALHINKEKRSEDILTTAVTDEQGTTHYYEHVTDEKVNISKTFENQGVYAEIETKSNGKAVTNKNGTYVTKGHTTVLPFDDETAKSISSTEKSSNTTNECADNNVDFEPDKPTEKTKPTTTEKPTTTATQKTTQPATDKDGWITKWY